MNKVIYTILITAGLVTFIISSSHMSDLELMCALNFVVGYIYSTSQTQGIMQTRSAREANAFLSSSNAGMSSFEHAKVLVRTREGCRSNAFHLISERVYILVRMRECSRECSRSNECQSSC